MLKDCEIHQFADDTLLYASGTNIDCLIDNLHSNLASVNHWLNGNKLKLNTKKTKCMLLTLKSEVRDLNRDIVIDGKKLNGLCLINTWE